MDTPRDNNEQADVSGASTPQVPAELLPRDTATGAAGGGDGTAVRWGSSPEKPAELSQPFPSMAMLLRGFRRCWAKAIVIGVFLAAGLGVAAWFLMPTPKARVRSLLYVASQNPHVLFPDREARRDFNEFKKTQATLAKTRKVLEWALIDKKIATLSIVEEQANAVEWLERELTVDYSAGPELMTIALVSDKEVEAIKLVDAVAAAYLKLIVEEDHNGRASQFQRLLEAQQAYSNLLKIKRKALSDLVDDGGNGNIDIVARKQKLAIEQLADTQKELLKVKSDVRRLITDISVDDKTKADTKITVSEGLVREAMEKDPKAQEFLKKLDELQQTIQAYKTSNPSKWKELTKPHVAQIEQITKALEERKKQVRPQIEAAIAEKQQNALDIQTTWRRNQLERLQELEKQLQKDVDNANLDQKVLGKQGVILEELREEIEQVDEVYKKVYHQVEVMKVEKAAEPRIHVVESAIAIRPDPFKRQVMASSVAGLGALALVLFGFSWWECRHLRVDCVEQVRYSLGVPVMGTLPLIPAARQQSRFGFSLADSMDWEYCLLESVDLLRTVLLHAAKTESLQVVMVTSALGGEGKTSLSSQLATSLARAGRKVLLIDGDMRKPCLHRVFDLPDWHGLCEALRGEIQAAEAIQTTAVPGLSILAAGECDEVALKALARGGVVDVLGAVRGQFDFVLVDSAPVLPVADSLLMAQAVDGVLLSLMRHVSRMAPVYAAHVRLAALNVRMLGAVLAGTHPLELYEHKYRYAGRVNRALETAAEEEAS
jgi:capsular exopolysaccharide synthesis family protein